MATIQKRFNSKGKVSYKVTVRIKPHPTQTSTFSLLSEAREWIVRTEANIKDCKQHSLNSNMTLSKLISLHKVTNERVTWWDRQLGKIYISDINFHILTQYRAKLQKDKKLANATVNRYMAELSAVFRLAVKELGILQNNPVHQLQKLKEAKGRTRYLTKEELDVLLIRCGEVDNKYLYPVVVIAVTTGARKSEIRNLTWRDVDLERKLLIFRDTKNGDTRSTPISSIVYDLLLELKENSKSKYLFPNELNTGISDIRRGWTKASKFLTDFRFHDLRHTAASYLAMNGATIMELSHILGHRTLTMVKRYAHLTDNHTAGIIEKMNKDLLG